MLTSCLHNPREVSFAREKYKPRDSNNLENFRIFVDLIKLLKILIWYYVDDGICI